VAASRDPVGRKRLLAVGALALASAGVGIAVGSAGGGSDEPPKRAEPRRQVKKKPKAPRLSLEKQVGRLLLLSFDGTEAPDYIHRRLRAGELAGVILFEDNVVSEEGLRDLTGALQRDTADRALIATDQEGGDMRSVPFAGPESSQSALESPDAAGEAAAETGTALRDLGVNLTLAPVADVAEPGSVLADRAFPGDPEDVASSVRATVDAYEKAGVAATAKHFPGLGEAEVNTDEAPVTIEATRERLTERDIVPFQAAVRAGVPLVMLSHALYPVYDGTNIASQSRTLIQRLLRRKLGFKGVAVTDSIEAQAVLDRSGVAAAAERSVRAGVDLILMTGSASWNAVFPQLLERARNSPKFRERVRRSAARVLQLKRRLGLRLP
jgi:beta-N-acetylhexosaminidase